MVCSPRKFLKMYALTSLLRPVLGLNMVHIGSDKLTCITLQENLVKTCSLGCKCADKSPFLLQCLSTCSFTITNAWLMVDKTSPAHEILASWPSTNVSSPMYK